MKSCQEEALCSLLTKGGVPFFLYSCRCRR